MLKDNSDISKLNTKDIMSKILKKIEASERAIHALETMENNNNITQILVEDSSNYVEIVHLHDLLKEGIF